MIYVYYLFATRNYKATFLLILFHVFIGYSFTWIAKLTGIYSIPSIAYSILPGILVCVFDIFFPVATASIVSRGTYLVINIFLLTMSTTFFFSLITQYIEGFTYDVPLYQYVGGGFMLTWFCFAVQSKIININQTREHGLLFRLKDGDSSSWIILIDLLFYIILLVAIIGKQNNLIEFIFFIYGFRLFRILLLVPYFDHIWMNIKRGLKLTGNYISAFLITLVIFSVNSRILFSRVNDHFDSIPVSVFTNFQIILGNGFDLVSDIRKDALLVMYVFAVTLVIGIIFTSTITALITDSLMAKKEAEPNSLEKKIWYKKAPGESAIEYRLRVIYKIAYL